jgi:hypoxanthine phosphoribosyltransferase
LTHAAHDAAIDRILFGEEAVQGAIARLAAELARDFRGKPLLLLGVLKGALYVTADLARALCSMAAGPSEIRTDFMVLSSYGKSNRSSGEVRMLKDAKEDISAKNVVVVEDIVDDGLTLQYLQALLHPRNPAVLKACALLDKPYHRRTQVRIDYVGMTAPDSFVVGYGLDYQERYRNLPYLARLAPWTFS